MIITNAQHLQDYTLRLTFENGQQRDFDFSDYVQKPMYKQYGSAKAFAKFKIVHNNLDLMWGDMDLMFEGTYLYKNGKAVPKSARAKAA